MRRVRIRRGLDVALPGEPHQDFARAPSVRSVAVLGSDHPELRPRLRVAVGDRVRVGDPLYVHRRATDVAVTAPGSGVVTRIDRGPRRALVAIVIELDGDDHAVFPAHATGELANLSREQVVEALLASGLWPVLRTRPFGRTPAPTATPRALLVTAMDTRPLAPDVERIVTEAREPFEAGLTVLRRLTSGPVHLCVATGSAISAASVPGVETTAFDGPHPAGLPGTHIHHLAPASRRHEAWHVGWQDVIAVGTLFTSGRLAVDRVVAISGAGVRNPRLARTRVGASLDELLDGELTSPDVRVISGSVLHGRRVGAGDRFLGRFDDQITVLPEDEGAEATALHGRPAPMVPLEVYERVLPFDVPVVPLLRALLVGDDETALRLGCLELVEEDLALCTYVCPAKQDYGPMLRAALDRIEGEG